MTKQNKNNAQREQRKMTNEELMAALYREGEIKILPNNGGFEVFEKDVNEKEAVHNAKTLNRGLVASQGYDPGHVMNTDRSREKIVNRFVKAAERNRVRFNFTLNITA